MDTSEIKEKRQSYLKNLQNNWVLVCASFFATYFSYSFVRSSEGGVVDWIAFCFFALTSVLGVLYVFLVLFVIVLLYWKERKALNQISKEIDSDYKEMFKERND